MKASGVSVDKDSLDHFFRQIEGKSVTDLVKEGQKKHVSMPAGGAGPAAAAGGAAATQEAPKEEKKEEVEEVDMGGLFGGDDDDY